MAVHVPLSVEAQAECRLLILSTNNILSPSSGRSIITPSQDMILGVYFLTVENPDLDKNNAPHFFNIEEALRAFDTKAITYQTPIMIRINGEFIDTTVGRAIFNLTLWECFDSFKITNYPYINKVIGKHALAELIYNWYRDYGNEVAADLCDKLKTIGFKYSTLSGISISIDDLTVPKEKNDILKEAKTEVDKLNDLENEQKITTDEKKLRAHEVWRSVTQRVSDALEKEMGHLNNIFIMAHSGARGNMDQVRQLAGMRGLMSDSQGRTVDIPIKSNFKEGLSLTEYFISAYGARKGLVDTALRTADSGYLTRRLVDVAQDSMVTIEDCGTKEGVEIKPIKSGIKLLVPLSELIEGRVALENITNPNDNKVIVKKGTMISKEVAEKIDKLEIESVKTRSVFYCKAERGICQACYGLDLSTAKPINVGEAIGIIAAQSIGEPGTQLTMRTFHTGGIASVADITSGLPRVEELFEARTPKGQAILSDIDGVVDLLETSDGLVVQVSDKETMQQEIQIPKGWEVKVKDGDSVIVGTELVSPKGQSLTPKEMKNNPNKILESSSVYAQVSGDLKVTKQKIVINWENEETREYLIPAASNLIVERGDSIEAGAPLTAGPKSPQQILAIQDINHVQKYLIEEVQNV